PHISSPSLHDALPICLGCRRTTGDYPASCREALAPPPAAGLRAAPGTAVSTLAVRRTWRARDVAGCPRGAGGDRLGEGLLVAERSEEHTSELQSPDHL